jgi:hypothetical protein
VTRARTSDLPDVPRSLETGRNATGGVRRYFTLGRLVTFAVSLGWALGAGAGKSPTPNDYSSTSDVTVPLGRSLIAEQGRRFVPQSP